MYPRGILRIHFDRVYELPSRVRLTTDVHQLRTADTVVSRIAIGL
jgi:hypothetical protein